MLFLILPPGAEHPCCVKRLAAMKKFLIVGLGNIGVGYTHTRHNIGFRILDHFATYHQLKWETVKFGDRAEYKVKGRTFVFLKPSTFMNLSGKAVLHHLTREKLTPNQLLVITDDLNLPFGSIRLKSKGGNGGHRGLRDIQSVLNTTITPDFDLASVTALVKANKSTMFWGSGLKKKTP